jgi:hypothetical protein
MGKFYKAWCVLLLAGGTWQATAQSAKPFVLNAAGGSFNDPNAYFHFEWSIGELTLINAMAPADSIILLTHGVLQPCTEFVTKSNISTLFAIGEYRLFPNPTAGRFELDFFVRESGRMELQLTDSYGKVLERRQYQYDGCCRIEFFNLTPYPAGTYYVIAKLSPNRNNSDGRMITRQSGFRVVKIGN